MCLPEGVPTGALSETCKLQSSIKRSKAPFLTRLSMIESCASPLHQGFEVDYLELSAEILRWDFKGL